MNSFPTSPVRYLITRGDLTASNFSTRKAETLAAIRSAAVLGIELVQIREKQLETADLFDLARNAVSANKGRSTRILVNERFDVALAAGADGVHLTSRAIPVDKVRQSVPEGFLIGVSTHSEREISDCEAAGADFALFGNVFATPGKGEAKGLDELAKICSKVNPFPVLAVGGIDESNAESVIEAGAAGFAAIRHLNEFVSIGE